MKKIATISVLMVLFLSVVVAKDGDRLVLLTSVQTKVPTFGIKASLDDSLHDATVGTQEGAFLYSEADVSDTSKIQAEIVYVSVVQENESKYRGKFNLSVTASALEKDADNKTDAPSWFLQNRIATPALEVSIPPDDIPFGTQTITTLVNYKTGTPIGRNTELFLIAFSWRSKANLAEGTYKSTIQLTYTAQ